MAGSLRHVMDGWNLIENMGDAYEAVEEMLFVILTEVGEDRAYEVIERFYGMSRGDIPKSEVYEKVNDLMNRPS